MTVAGRMLTFLGMKPRFLPTQHLRKSNGWLVPNNGISVSTLYHMGEEQWQKITKLFAIETVTGKDEKLNKKRKKKCNV